MFGCSKKNHKIDNLQTTNIEQLTNNTPMKYSKCIVIILLCTNFVAYSQDTTASITVLSGSTVHFYFNSYEKIEDGVMAPYSNGWTRLRTRYKVNGVSSVPWVLMVRSATNEIEKDGSGDNLSLGTVRIRADGAGVHSKGWKDLSNSDVVLVEGSTNSAVVITIYYECGTSNCVEQVKGKDPGYYFGDLIFTLTREP